MNLLIEPASKDNLYLEYIDGIILPLTHFAVESKNYFTLDEIEKICMNHSLKVFVKINKNLMNDDIDELREILKRMDSISNISGVFFYDLAVLQLKKELKLNIDLIWNQTHMVNNYRTCNYYFNKGVKYALLGKEITLEEIKEIIKKSNIISMVEVVSKPSVAFSKRKLITNYYQDLGVQGKNDIVVREKVSDTFYEIYEDDNGTCFFLNSITNGTSIIRDLYDCGCQYIIFREYGLEEYFKELLIDTKNYILHGCLENDYVEKYKKIGDSTNFFFKKTVYRVKKNG